MYLALKQVVPALSQGRFRKIYSLEVQRARIPLDVDMIVKRVAPPNKATKNRTFKKWQNNLINLGEQHKGYINRQHVFITAIATAQNQTKTPPNLTGLPSDLRGCKPRLLFNSAYGLCAQSFYPCRQAGDFPACSVLVHNTFGHAAHDFRLCTFQSC